MTADKAKRLTAGELAQRPEASGQLRSPICPGKLPPGQRRCADSSSLVAAVRQGRASELPELLSSACARVRASTSSRALAEEQSSQLAASSLRVCATRRCFNQGLAAFERVQAHIGKGNPELWSLLLYSCVEGGRLDLGRVLFERLAASGRPQSYDYVNMVRCLAREHDVSGLRHLLEQMQNDGAELDAVSRNKALAMCVNENEMTMAELVLASDVCSEALDVVSYNTLLKGYSKVGDSRRCSSLSREMEAKCVAPSSVTFGILLDAAAKRKDRAGTRELLQAIRRSDMTCNVVHYTSILKGLVSAGFLDEAMEMLGEMRSRPGTTPDLFAYMTVLRALGEGGRAREGVAILQQMRENEVVIDEIAFHSVLDGCTHGQQSGQEVLQLLAQLVDLGLQPSTATLSIVLKALSRTRSFELAWTFLEGSHSRCGASVVRPRLFVQLGQACIRGGCEHRAAHLYRRFLELDASASERAEGWVAQQLIRTCLASGGERYAREIYGAATQDGVHLHPWVAKSLFLPAEPVSSASSTATTPY